MGGLGVLRRPTTSMLIKQSIPRNSDTKSIKFEIDPSSFDSLSSAANKLKSEPGCLVPAEDRRNSASKARLTKCFAS